MCSIIAYIYVVKLQSLAMSFEILTFSSMLNIARHTPSAPFLYKSHYYVTCCPSRGATKYFITGCPCDSAYCLRLLSSCSNVWPAKHRHTCQPIASLIDSRPRRLWSSDPLTCVVRRAHNTYGDRCFATAGPRVWNSLPAELQQCDSRAAGLELFAG